MGKFKHAEEKRKAIIDAYIELLQEMPFEQISLRTIEQRCGISHRMFYYYFQDKEEILLEVMKSTWKPYLDSQDEALDALSEQSRNEMNFRDKIRFLLKIVLAQYREKEPVLYALFAIIRNPKLRAEYQRLNAVYFKEFADRIARLGIKEELAYKLSYLLTAFIDGVTLDSSFLNDEQVDHVIDTFISLMPENN